MTMNEHGIYTAVHKNLPVISPQIRKTVICEPMDKEGLL